MKVPGDAMYIRKKKLAVMLAMCILSLSACNGDENTAKSGESNSKTDDAVMEEQETETNVQDKNADTKGSEGYPSTDTVDLTNSKEYEVGETAELENAAVQYNIVIDSVEYNDTLSDDPIVIIRYTYTNDSDKSLLIDSMRFQLIDSETRELYEPFYHESLGTADVADKGESVNAEIAFTVNDHITEAQLAYRDTENDDIIPIIINIKDMMGGRR